MSTFGQRGCESLAVFRRSCFVRHITNGRRSYELGSRDYGNIELNLICSFKIADNVYHRFVWAPMSGEIRGIVNTYGSGGPSQKEDPGTIPPICDAEIYFSHTILAVDGQQIALVMKVD